MPVFVDAANTSRDLRVMPSKALPLPRLCPESESITEVYDVVIAGAGPAGALLTLLLARYGIGDDRLLCVDSKAGSMKAGQADGLQPRTLEVFKSLGLADEILNEACQMWELAFWNPGNSGIQRSNIVPNIGAPARYAQEFTIHQGRIERILLEDLARYSTRGVQYESQIVSARIEDTEDTEYPVVVEIRAANDPQAGNLSSNTEYSTRTVRAKHLVGCDGAHSTVRKLMNLKLEGDTRDHIWGVVDLIVDTDFPDIRRRCAVHSDAGSAMVIPRERTADGDFLTRLYVQVTEEVPADCESGPGPNNQSVPTDDTTARDMGRQRRSTVSLEGLLRQATAIFHPYSMAPKAGTEVDWWAAYQVGQRMADKFSVKDTAGVPRVFIAGDACHTHSPKAGQGMNVSMMDAYNLSWKLALHLQGLTTHPIELLNSYEWERKKIAAELIHFDHEFSSMFSGRIEEQEISGLTHEEFENVFKKINGFTTGCGVEYPDSSIVWRTHDRSLVDGDDYLSGILEPGRRLFNVRLIRHADSAPWDLQDDLSSTGRFRIIVLTSTDLLQSSGISATTLNSLDLLIDKYPSSMVELSVLHCLHDNIRGIPWNHLPPTIKKRAEMRFYSARPDEAPEGQEGRRRQILGADDAYTIYGVHKEHGALCVVRPDGYVGALARLDDVSRLAGYLDQILASSNVSR